MQIVFLHALPFQADMWIDQVKAFPEIAYAPNLYPCGGDLRDWAQYALKGAQSDQLILVGNSTGGSCALEMAALSPKRVKGMVLIGTKAERITNSQQKDACVNLLENEEFDTAWQTYWAPLFGPNISPAILAKAKAKASSLPIKDLVFGVKAFHTRPSRLDLLSTLECPIVCVSGAQDVAPGPQITKMQAQTARNGTYIEVPDCGHYVPLEKPDEMNAIILDIFQNFL